MKRRGSWPVSITLSTTPKTPRAVAGRERVDDLVEQVVGGVAEQAGGHARRSRPSGPAPPSSWSSTESESRAEPAPARTTSGSAAGSIRTPSCSQMPAR